MIRNRTVNWKRFTSLKSSLVGTKVKKIVICATNKICCVFTLFLVSGRDSKNNDKNTVSCPRFFNVEMLEVAQQVYSTQQ